MINPKEKDIGRTVIFRPGHWSNSNIEEKGIITSFNEVVVFVRYNSNKQPKATLRSDLTWEIKNV